MEYTNSNTFTGIATKFEDMYPYWDDDFATLIEAMEYYAEDDDEVETLLSIAMDCKAETLEAPDYMGEFSRSEELDAGSLPYTLSNLGQITGINNY